MTIVLFISSYNYKIQNFGYYQTIELVFESKLFVVGETQSMNDITYLQIIFIFDINIGYII